MHSSETWLQKKWRPAVAVTYMVICICDFIVFPVLWNLFQAHLNGTITMWKPITLEGAGMFHMSYGAILGVAAYTRGREKISYWENNRYESREVEQETAIQPRYKPPVRDNR